MKQKIFGCSVLLFVPILIFAQKSVPGAIDIRKGEMLYKENCAACHGINKKILGPALPAKAGLAMDKIDPTWILKWVRNSQALIRNHDTTATRLYKEYNKIDMPSFPQLTTEDIHSIGAYTLKESKRLDSLQKIKDIQHAVIAATKDAADPVNIRSYFTMTHLIIFIMTMLVLFTLVVILNAFNIITFQLRKDETELRTLRALNEEHKSKKNHGRHNL